MKKRLLMCILGNMGISVGVALIVFAKLGSDPFNTLAVGISNCLQLGLGITMFLINFIFLIIMLIFDRKNIGVGTIINCFINGFFIEYFYNIFINNITFTFINQVITLILGIIILCPSVGLYMSSSLGIAPWDDFANIIIKKFHNLSYKTPRIIQESIAVIIGGYLLAPIGLATIILTFSLGPLINITKDYFEAKLL